VRVHVLGNVLGDPGLLDVADQRGDHPRRRLSFLGLASSRPEPEWGLMLNTVAPGDLRQSRAGGIAGRDDLHDLDLLQPDERGLRAAMT